MDDQEAMYTRRARANLLDHISNEAKAHMLKTLRKLRSLALAGISASIEAAQPRSTIEETDLSQCAASDRNAERFAIGSYGQARRFGGLRDIVTIGSKPWQRLNLIDRSASVG